MLKLENYSLYGVPAENIGRLLKLFPEIPFEKYREKSFLVQKLQELNRLPKEYQL
ncbi:hypothetical protein AWB71_05317 [Caballeronia peredens]|nr:hypothetical protein AWB71_05317 [Caballeronia peredens]